MPNMETQWATEFNVHKLKSLSQMIIKSTLCFILCGRNVSDYHLVFSTFVFPKTTINRKSVGDRGGLGGWRTSGTMVKVSWTPSLRKWFLTGNPQRALRSIQNAHKVSTSYRMAWRHYLPFSLSFSHVCTVFQRLCGMQYHKKSQVKKQISGSSHHLVSQMWNRSVKMGSFPSLLTNLL